MSLTDNNIKTNQLRVFGIGFAAIFAIIAFIFRNDLNTFFQIVFIISSAFFLMFGIIHPRGLIFAYKPWMTFADYLAWANTNLILFVAFFLLFIPMGLIIKTFRIDLLGTTKKKGSYWLDPGSNPRKNEHYRNQY